MGKMPQPTIADAQAQQAPAPASLSHRRWQWVTASLTALVAIALYAYTLRLPLFRDAMVMLRWMDHRSVAQMWINARGFPYYRPLAWMFLKAFQFGPGRFYAAGMHAQNVALHALDGALVSLLAWRLWTGRGRAVFAALTGLFFVTYPFSYEVVPVVGPIFQLVVTGLMVGSILLYWESRRRDATPLFLFSLALGLAAPFASEYGVTLGLLLLAVEWLESRRGRFQSFSWRPLLYLALAAGYVAIWFLIPKSRGDGLPLLSLETLGQKGAYFLQGLVFPVAPLVRSAGGGAPTSGYGAVFALAAVMTGLLTFLFLRARRRSEWAFFLAWFAIGVLPLWPTLDLDYVLNGPRLFYVASAGAAMVWAGLAVVLGTRARRRCAGRALGLLVALIVLAGNVTFLVRMQNVLASGGRIVDRVVATATEHSDDTPLLFVNFPSWLSPRSYRFPLGWEGISLLPGYSDVADLIYTNTGRQMNARNVAATVIWKEGPLAERFYTQPIGLVELAPEMRRADAVYVVQNESSGLQLVQAGQIQSSPSPPTAQAVFDKDIFVRLEEVHREGERLTVRLAWWREDNAPQGDMTCFLHIYDESGQLVGQADGYPLLGLYPAWLWEEGEIVRDLRVVSLPAGPPPGELLIGAGVYEVGSGERVPATDAEGAPLLDGVAILGAYRQP